VSHGVFSKKWKKNLNEAVDVNDLHCALTSGIQTYPLPEYEQLKSRLPVVESD
jgi:hypothetical protein